MSMAPRVCARPVLPDGSQGDADTYVLASDYDAVTRERDEARAQAGEANDERLNADARWTEIIADELAENRRLMDLGGAREGENFSTFAERVIAERDAVRAEVERLKKAEADFHMAYRLKCDEETKALHVEVGRLRGGFERHALKAGECPPDSVVVLVSSMRRLAALQEPTP